LPQEHEARDLVDTLVSLRARPLPGIGRAELAEERREVTELHAANIAPPAPQGVGARRARRASR
jgi:hypothetical protein